MKSAQLIFLPIALLALPCAAVEVNEALAASFAVAAFGPEASSSNFSLAAIQLGADQQDKLARDIDDLEGLVTGLVAEEATPELQPLLRDVEALINDTLDQVIVAWNATWEMMNKSNASFEDCWYRQVYLGDMDEYARAHYYCRLEEAAAKTTYDLACNYANEVAGLMWQTCSEFHNIYNPVSELVPDICEPNGHRPGELGLTAETNEDRATRLAGWFKDRSDQWHEKWTECDTKFNDSMAANTTCYEQTDRWQWHERRCDLLQEKLDWVGCNYYRRNNCSEHERCWINAEDHYKELNVTIFKRFKQHWVEWAGLRRIRCLIRAIGSPDDVREQGIEDCRLGARTGVNYDFLEILASVRDHMEYRWNNAPDSENPTPLGGDPSTWSPDAHFVIIRPIYCKRPYAECPDFPPFPACLPAIPPVADVKPGTIMGDNTAWLDAYLTPHNLLPNCSSSTECPWPVNAPWAPCKSVCCTICFFYEECRARPHVPNSHDVEVYPGIFSEHAHKTCCQTADWVVSDWNERCETGCNNPAKDIFRNVTCVTAQGELVANEACNDTRLDNQPWPVAQYTCPATAECNLTCSESCPVGQYRTGCEGGAGATCTWCTLVESHYFTSDGGDTDSCNTARCEVEECGLGQFLDNCEGFGSQGTCRMCTIPDGHYATGRGLYRPRSCPTQPCEVCPAGQYRAGCGLQGPGECRPCTPVPGKFFTGPGTNDIPTSCPEEDCLIDCPLGQHRVGCEGASPGQCENCSLPPHTYAVDFGRQHDRCSSFPCAPDKCSPGKYLASCEGTSKGVCELCNPPPTGYWYKKHGQFDPNCTANKCVNCSVGYWREHCGGTETPMHGGHCTLCTPPASGYFHITHGGTTNNCQAKSCTAPDMKCPKGQYRWNCGGHLKGACVACDAPPEGRYQTADGGLTKTCPDAECDASRCAVGYYLKSCGGRQHPTKPGTCVPCTPPRTGYYLASHGGQANTCTYNECAKLDACPPGQYRTGCGGHDHPTSTGTCVPCTNSEDGFYFISHGGLSPDGCQKRSCLTLAPCNNGYHRKDCGTANAPTSVGSCEPCTDPPFGKFASGSDCTFESCTDNSLNNLYPCGVGQYLLGCGAANESGSTGACTACSSPSAGMYFTDHGGIRDACTESSCEAPGMECGPGKYRKDCGAPNTSFEGECVYCTAPGFGNYSSGTGTRLNDPDSCAQSSCLDIGNCAIGHYRRDCGNPAANPGECVECTTPPPAGFYIVGNGGFTDNCTLASCADLPNCPTGEYRSGCGTAGKGEQPTDISLELWKALGNGSCSPCNAPAAGKYITGHGGLSADCPQTNCSLAPTCPIGQWRSGCGTNPTTGIGECLACAALQPGFYYYTDGGLDAQCSQDSCANVGDCGIGSFRAKCGAPDYPASRGECQPCTGLPLGFRWSTSGGLNNSCESVPIQSR